MTPAEIQAAIQRGTLVAFEQFNTIEADAVAGLVKLYEDTAQELAALIQRYAATGNKIDISVLQVLLAEINQRIEALGQACAIATTDAIRAATGTGAAAVAGILPEALVVSAATGASEFVLNLHRAGGLGLSDRLWQNQLGAKDVVARAVQAAIVTGEGPYEAAWELIAESAGKALLTDTNNALFKAARVMRTEMLRAHSAAFENAVIDIPGAKGVKFNLSPMHTVADQCDTIASQDLYGLGAGVYPFRTLNMPIHPHGRSYLTVVF